MAKRPLFSIPSVQSPVAPDLRQFVDRVREALNSGILATKDDLKGLGGGSSMTIINNGMGFGSLDPNALPNPTPDRECGETEYPTAPTGLEADGAFQNIILVWDVAPYCGHHYTEVWAADVDNLSSAMLVGQVPWGNIFVHAVGGDKQRYYWIRFVNDLSDIGPWNATAGTFGETQPDIEYLLDLLADAITEAQLYQDLQERIDRIDDKTSITDVNEVLADGDSATATAVRQLAANTIDDPEGTVMQIEQRVTNNEGQYTVKIDNHGHVTGFGLASTPVDGVPHSMFLVNANMFSIVPPAVHSSAAPANPYKGMLWIDSGGTSRYYTGTTWSTDTADALIPFTVLTTGGIIGGEEFDPGVYIDTAFIRNGSIQSAKIGDAVIDDAKIADVTAGKISSGEITVGTEIRSASYEHGNYGWKITGDGNLYAFNGEFTGHIIADTGWFKGTILGGQATSWWAGNGLAGQIQGDGGYYFRIGAPRGDGAGLYYEQSAAGTPEMFEIRDQNNKVVFSAGGIPSNVLADMGIKGLAYKDKATTSDVDGLGTLATRDDVRVDNGELLVWDSAAGGYATINTWEFVHKLRKISSGTISTFMETAAIGNAYIGNAAVSTLKIDGNAVTVPSGTYNSGATYGQGNWNWRLAAYVYVNNTHTSSVPVMIQWSVRQGYSSGARNTGYNLRYGGTLSSSPAGTISLVDTHEAEAINDFPAGCFKDTLPGQTSRYYMLFWFGEDSTVGIVQRAMTAIGAKR